jgi:hypothetical protein
MPNSNDPQNPGGFKGWLTKNPGAILLILVLLVIIIYQKCKEPDTPTEDDKPALTFNPLNAGVIVDSLGNGDGQVNPDEQIKIRLRLTNPGKTAIAGFDLELTTPDSGVILIDNRLHFNRIEPGQSALSEDTFEFKMPRRFISPSVIFHGGVKNIKQAGLIAKAFAAPLPECDITVILPVALNYRVCVISATLQDNDNTAGASDILSLNLMLCNASLKPNATTAGPVLSDASLTIRAIVLKACREYVVAAPPEAIAPVANNVLYGTVAAGACNNPISSFSFVVPPAWAAAVPQVQNPTLCLHFTAEIYSNSSSSEAARTPEGAVFVGVNARVNRPTPGNL